jgi:hypothetical protein
MAVTDRVAVLAPYAQQLLCNQEVQDAGGSALDATPEAYGRARGESVSEAVQDKQLRRRLEQAGEAVGEVWSAIGEPHLRRDRRGARVDREEQGSGGRAARA